MRANLRNGIVVNCRARDGAGMMTTKRGDVPFYRCGRGVFLSVGIKSDDQVLVSNTGLVLSTNYQAKFNHDLIAFS